MNETTKVSPYEALYGIQPCDDLSLLDPEVERAADSSLEESVSSRTSIRSQTEASIAWAQARMATYYNENHELKEFKIGDSVMLSTKDYSIPGLKKGRLTPRRIGPFRIAEKIGKLAYRFHLPTAYQIHNVVSIAKLERVTNDVLNSRPPPIVTSIGGDPVYEVESILAQGNVGKTLKYKDLWKGYPESECTWEPALQLAKTAPDVVARWKDDLGDQQGR